MPLKNIRQIVCVGVLAAVHQSTAQSAEMTVNAIEASKIDSVLTTMPSHDQHIDQDLVATPQVNVNSTVDASKPLALAPICPPTVAAEGTGEPLTHSPTSTQNDSLTKTPMTTTPSTEYDSVVEVDSESSNHSPTALPTEESKEDTEEGEAGNKTVLHDEKIEIIAIDCDTILEKSSTELNQQQVPTDTTEAKPWWRRFFLCQ